MYSLMVPPGHRFLEAGEARPMYSFDSLLLYFHLVKRPMLKTTILGMLMKCQAVRSLTGCSMFLVLSALV